MTVVAALRESTGKRVLPSTLALAQEFGVADRLVAVVGVGEELPLAADTVDAIVAGGTLHHMVTSAASAEIHRVLAAGGRFAAYDPWRTPVYGIGTRVFGKREKEVHCRPLTDERLEAFQQQGFGSVQVDHFNAALRYPLILLGKFGIGLSADRVRRALRWEVDHSDPQSRLQRTWGSSLLLRVTK